MALELGLRTLLLQQPAITALVPAQAVNKLTLSCIFNEFPEQGVIPPYIVISVIDFDPMKAFDGTYGMTKTEIDVDCYHTSYPSVVAIAEKVATFLKDYTGLAGTDDRINAVLWNGKRHDLVPTNDGRDMRHHIIGLNFEIQSTAL